MDKLLDCESLQNSPEPFIQENSELTFDEEFEKENPIFPYMLFWMTNLLSML